MRQPKEKSGMASTPRGRYAFVLVLVVALTCVTGCDKLKARDKLNKGVQAYKGGQFDAAIQDFQDAKQLDPNLKNARLYLATAYSSQYIPGAPSPENIRMGQQAISEYQGVLNDDPNNLSAIDGIGAILYNMASNPFDEAKFEESKKYHQKHIELKPDDPDSYYWIGVIDWSLAYRGNKDMRAKYNASGKKPVKDTDPMPPALTAEFTAKYGQTVDEGINDLKKAIELKPDYDDAMAYLNLLYRQKADMETTPAARDEDEKLADELVDKVKAIKQKKENAAQPTGD
jgi:tetratricopeptide (TPR) repeat protein